MNGHTAGPRRLLAALLAAAALLAVGAAGAGAATIYSNIPKPLPPGMNSQPFQAQQTSEFGGQVQFAGIWRKNPTVTVAMSSWACQVGTWNWPAEGTTCITSPGATFNQPITLKIYAVNPGNLPGALLASVTKTFAIPYRPSASRKCTGENAGKFYSKGECFNEKVTKLKFENLGLTLPFEKAIISVAFNTSNYGAEPQAPKPCNSEPQGCPYDSLNVAVRGSWEASPTPSVGSDPLPESAYISSLTAADYCENPAAVGTFGISQNCWTGEQPAFEVSKTTR